MTTKREIKVHLVQMSRNNTSFTNDSTQNCSLPAHMAKFYLMDYFDVLYYADQQALRDNGQEHRLYEFFFGKQEIFEPNIQKEPPIAYQLLTLMEETDGVDTPNPFLYDVTSSNKNTLSDKPYLALISIAVLPDSSSIQKDPQEFFNECRDEISKIINNNYDNLFIYKIYTSLTSGSFLVAIRTSDLALAYNLASQIRAKSLYTVFTTVGIEFRENENGIPLGFPQKELDNNLNDCVKVILRLALKNGATLSVSQNKNLAPGVVVGGLYGRYDFSVTLSLQQFQQLYPLLCAYKNCKHINEVNIEDKGAPLIKVVAENIKNGNFKIVNERVQLDIQMGSSSETNLSEKNAIDIEYIRKRNVKKTNTLNKLIANVKLKRNVLPAGRENFRECITLIENMLRTYAGTYLETDSLLNGRIFYHQMQVLLSSVERHIKHIEKSIQNKDINVAITMCQDMNIWMRHGINGINSYNKLIQSINQQSIQAPHYEMQMQFDMEKYLIAYSKFLQTFSENFCHRNTQDYERLLPVFTVDFSKMGISAKALFLNPQDNYPVEIPDYVSSNPEQEILFFVYTPSSLSFALPHETLPLICHEISHQFRFIEREQRNEALGKYLLAHVVNSFVRFLLCSNTLETELLNNLFNPYLSTLEKSLIESLWVVFTRNCTNWENMNLELFTSSLKWYLQEEIFINGKQLSEQQEQLQITNLIKNILGEWEKKIFATLPQKEIESFRSEINIDGINHEKLINIDKKLIGYSRNLHKAYFNDIVNFLKQKLPDIGGDKTLIYNTLNYLDISEDECIYHYLITAPSSSECWALCYNNYRILSGYLEQSSDVGHNLLQQAGLDQALLSPYFNDIYMLNSYHLLLQKLSVSLSDKKNLSSESGSFKESNGDDSSNDIRKKLAEEIYIQLKKGLPRKPEINSYNQQYEFIVHATHINSRELEFTTELISKMEGFDNQPIEDIIMGFVDVYREACADLVACAAMGLSPFGYLRFYTKSYWRKMIPESNLHYNLYDLRAAAVVDVLMDTLSTNHEKAWKILVDKVKRYFTDAYDKISYQAIELVKQIVPQKAGDCRKNLECFFGSLNKTMENIEKEETAFQTLYPLEYITSEKIFINQNKAMSIESFFGCEDPVNNVQTGVPQKISLQRLFEYLKQLELLAFTVEHVFAQRNNYTECDVREHLSRMYKKQITKGVSEPGCFWETQIDKDDIKLRELIQEYYNEPVFRNFDQDFYDQLFFQNLKFVQNYFYKTQIDLVKEIADEGGYYD